MAVNESLDAELAVVEQRARAHFEDVERAIANRRLGELLRDLPPIEEQIRQAKREMGAVSQ